METKLQCTKNFKIFKIFTVYNENLEKTLLTVCFTFVVECVDELIVGQKMYV